MDSDSAAAAATIDRDDLIEAIAAAELPPAVLARSFQLSLHELAAWARDPANADAVEQLARLAELRARMVLAQFRATAAARLAQIANGDASELARKACVDLLKTAIELPAVKPVQHHGESSTSAPSAPPADAILNLLQAIGEASLHEDEPTPSFKTTPASEAS